ncbi:hypothetical protein [Dactylosporangium sp. CA-233914]|uniref:hypothetical protein n=1 Tax=Dactylosporangium sp. CA-233914 TaxID=3239934 RepID=UPI003D8D04B8
MRTRTAITRSGTLAVASLALVLAGGAAPAHAGTAGVDPAGCGTGGTPKYTDFNVGGVTMREELRYASGCGRVGWGRLTRIGGASTSLALTQSAWNPGGPSQYGVPGTNWTYTVDANPGVQVCAGFHASSIDWLGNQHYIGWFYAGCYTAP